MHVCMNIGSKIALRAGSVFVIGGFLFFLGLVLYYVWQFQFGETETRYQLAQTFGTEFSIDGTHDSGIGSLTQVADPERLIAAYNPTIGNPGAPITIIAFIDFECPYCRRAYATFERIRERYAPVAHIVFKHYPLESIHPNARTAAIAAQCAATQGKFWEYYQAVFEGVSLTDARLRTYATNIGLDTMQFDTCTASTETTRLITNDMTDGVEIGVRGTPTYIVNGTKYEGVIESETWDQIMLLHLNK